MRSVTPISRKRLSFKFESVFKVEQKAERTRTKAKKNIDSLASWVSSEYWTNEKQESKAKLTISGIINEIEKENSRDINQPSEAKSRFREGDEARLEAKLESTWREVPPSRPSRPRILSSFRWHISNFYNRFFTNNVFRRAKTVVKNLESYIQKNDDHGATHYFHMFKPVGWLNLES